MAAPFWQDAPPAQFAVLGDPVGHSWSPAIHNAALQAMGRRERYVALHVPLEEFEHAVVELKDRGYIGVNCTIPLKEAAAAWAESIDAESRRFGTLNTLNLQTGAGTNTDAPGFLETLRDLRVEPPGPVLLLGAGATARTLTLALHDHGFDVRIFNRTEARAHAMLASMNLDLPVLAAPSVADHRLILNTTSAGLSENALDIAWGSPEAGTVAYDVVYRQDLTPFLKDALTAGCRVVDGRAMLVAQAALALEWWLDVPVPRDVMLAALPGAGTV